jgi:hypothetical protein
MSSGLAIISTNCGGSVDILTPSQVMPQPGDFQSIAREMKLCRIKNPDERTIAKSRVISFSIESAAHNWIQLYTNGAGLAAFKSTKF